jgi:hypothetical protein
LVLFIGCCLALLLVSVAALLSVPDKGDDSDYYRQAFVEDQWPIAFYPDIGLQLACTETSVEVVAFDVTQQPPRKLRKLPEGITVMKYVTACSVYFTTHPQASKGAAYAAVVIDQKSRLVHGGGGAASAEDRSSWFFMKKGYTAYIQTKLHPAKGTKEIKPKADGAFVLPRLAP